ncbi:MAG TPA: PLP-dependent aminotransferase family protein [Polyangiaceae bacterium]|nr:PLP-dependent aminotransferase family protein [Polyangiaceae bacterium]
MKSNSSSLRRQPPAPIAAQDLVHALLRSLVQSLGPGERLPSVRALVNEHHVSPVTVQRALAQLAREGHVITRPGDGTFVASRIAPARAIDVAWQSAALAAPFASARELESFFLLPREGTLVLGSGYPDPSLQPLELLAKAAQRASRRARTWSRLAVDGLPELRHWFANDVGGDAHADQALLVPGGQAALSTLFRALVPFGGPLIVESPTYFGALGIARAFGLRLIPVPHDAEGIRPDLLRAALASTGARVLYLQPWFSNPTGVSLSPERRSEVLKLVKSANAFLIEDDYARDLVIDGAPPAPLYREGEGHVIYVRSLTKSTASGLRVGAILASGPVLGRLKTARAVDDWFLSGLLQETALELVTSRSFAGHVRKLRAALKERRDAAVHALARHLPEARLVRLPTAGFSLWLELPSRVDETQLVEQAARASVHVNAGAPWFPAEPSGPHLRISIAGAPTDVLSEGIRRLGQIYRGARN